MQSEGDPGRAPVSGAAVTAEALEALEDPLQLRAMLAGKEDTLRHRQAIIERLEAANTALSADLAEWQQKTVDLSEEMRERGRQVAVRDQALADLRAELSEWQGKAVTLSEELRESGRQIGEWMTRTDELGQAVERAESELRQNRALLESRTAGLQRSRGRLNAISGNFQIYDRFHADLPAEAAELERNCEAMRRDMSAAPEPYKPSQFWEQFYTINMRQLREAGISNFKLTVNQNYQNYIPRSLNDPKIRPLLRWYRGRASLRPLFAVIDNPDGVANEGYLTEPGTSIFNDDRQVLALYRTLVTLGWEYSRAHDPLQLCAHLEEPELGNPIRVTYCGRLLSQDLATSVIEATDLMVPLLRHVGERPVSILEVGGGYGRLAHALISTQKVARYVIVDIPPALHVSQWYLSRLFPDRKVFAYRPFQSWEEVREEAEQAEILFLLAHQIELLPDGFVDASTAVSALHEMKPDLANTYLQQMGRLSRHVIASKHYWSYTNPYDGLVFRRRDYVRPGGFVSASVRADALNPVFFTEIFERAQGLQGGIGGTASAPVTA